MRLSGVVRDAASVDAAKEAMDALQRYRENMRRLVDVTVRNDGLVAEMAERADTLVQLTDEARERQHKSNADIVESLADGDRKLRLRARHRRPRARVRRRRRRRGALSRAIRIAGRDTPPSDADALQLRARPPEERRGAR